MSKKKSAFQARIKHLDSDFRPARCRETMQALRRGLEKQYRKEFVADIHRL